MPAKAAWGRRIKQVRPTHDRWAGVYFACLLLRARCLLPSAMAETRWDVGNRPSLLWCRHGICSGHFFCFALASSIYGAGVRRSGGWLCPLREQLQSRAGWSMKGSNGSCRLSFTNECCNQGVWCSGTPSVHSKNSIIPPQTLKVTHASGTNEGRIKITIIPLSTDGLLRCCCISLQHSHPFALSNKHSHIFIHQKESRTLFAFVSCRLHLILLCEILLALLNIP